MYSFELNIFGYVFKRCVLPYQFHDKFYPFGVPCTAWTGDIGWGFFRVVSPLERCHFGAGGVNLTRWVASTKTSLDRLDG